MKIIKAWSEFYIFVVKQVHIPINTCPKSGSFSNTLDVYNWILSEFIMWVAQTIFSVNVVPCFATWMCKTFWCTNTTTSISREFLYPNTSKCLELKGKKTPKTNIEMYTVELMYKSTSLMIFVYQAKLIDWSLRSRGKNISIQFYL